MILIWDSADDWSGLEGPKWHHLLAWFIGKDGSLAERLGWALLPLYIILILPTGFSPSVEELDFLYGGSGSENKPSKS